MKKRYLVSLLALLLCACMMVPVLAVDGEYPDESYPEDDVYGGEYTDDAAEDAPAESADLHHGGVLTAAEMEALFQKGAKSVQVGDYLLQADEYTGNVRLTNMRTGDVVNSIPAMFIEGTENLNSGMRGEFYSDIVIEVAFDASRTNEEFSAGSSTGGHASDHDIDEANASVHAVNSFDACVARDQLHIETLDNGFLMTYDIGQVVKPLHPFVMTEEDWNIWIEKVEDPDRRAQLEDYYTRIDFDEVRAQIKKYQKLVKQHRGNEEYEGQLLAWSYTAGEGARIYRASRQLYDRGAHGVYYTWYEEKSDRFTNITRAAVAEWWAEAGMTVEDYEEICQHANGFSDPFFEGGITLPVTITVSKDGVLTYKAETKDIKTYPMYYLTTLSCGRFLVSSTSTDEGYLVVPSGSGAIISNASENAMNAKAEYPLMGMDNATSQSAGIPYRAQSVLPVFGVVRNDMAMTGIVHSMESMATAVVELNARVGDTRLNWVNTRFDMSQMDSIKINGRAQDTDEAYQIFPRVIVDKKAYTCIPNEDILLTYTMTTGDKANYSAMAEVYRETLLEKGMTERLQAEDNIPLMADVYGCVDRSQLILGVPFNTKYALTKFAQAREIMEYLETEAGVKDFAVRYLGWFNGGVFNTAPMKVKVQRQLGGTSALEELNTYMTEKGYDLYPDVNLVTVPRDEMFDGFNPNRMTAKRIDFVYAIICTPDLVTGETLQWQSRYAISPHVYDKLFNKFRAAADAKVSFLKKYAFSESGNSLTGDYTLNEYTYTNEAQQKVTAFMDGMKKDGYDIATETGNAYMFPYASTIFRAPMTSSKLLIETEQIPLLQMVLHGSIRYCGESINEHQDTNKYILECLEYGSLPYVRTMYAADETLKDTELLDYFSMNYKDWTEEITTIYGKVNAVMKDLQDQRIVDHEILSSKARKTTYEDGTQIIVNYDEVPFVYEGKTVAGEGYLVLGGTANS